MKKRREEESGSLEFVSHEFVSLKLFSFLTRHEGDPSFSLFYLMVSEPTRELGCWNNNPTTIQLVPVCFSFI